MNPGDLERELAAATAGIHPPASAWSQIAHRGRVRRARRVAVASAVAVAALFAGGIAWASSQWLDGDTPPLATTASPEPSASAHPTASTTSGPTPAPSASAAAAVMTMTHDYWFTSPSRNIQCFLSVTYSSVECEVHEHTWKAPPAGPGRCDFGDWATSVFVGPAKARFTCETDTVFVNPPVVLPYGTTVHSSAIDCTSSREGMRCIRRETEHGFFLSRARYELF